MLKKTKETGLEKAVKKVEKQKKSSSNKKNTKSSITKSTITKKATPKIKVPSQNSKKNSIHKVNSTEVKTKSHTKATNELQSKPSFSSEFYDLPFRYNQTIIRILAQTPTTLFVYWEISDEDRTALKKQYGEYFFEITKPVLVVYNETLNYSFEIDIDDFANSWYLTVDDSNSKYKIELGRLKLLIFIFHLQMN